MKNIELKKSLLWAALFTSFIGLTACGGLEDAANEDNQEQQDPNDDQNNDPNDNNHNGDDPHDQGDDPHNHGDDPHDHGDDPHDHGDDPHDHGDDPHDHGDDPHDHPAPDLSVPTLTDPASSSQLTALAGNYHVLEKSWMMAKEGTNNSSGTGASWGTGARVSALQSISIAAETDKLVLSNVDSHKDYRVHAFVSPSSTSTISPAAKAEVDLEVETRDAEQDFMALAVDSELNLHMNTEEGETRGHGEHAETIDVDTMDMMPAIMPGVYRAVSVRSGSESDGFKSADISQLVVAKKATTKPDVFGNRYGGVSLQAQFPRDEDFASGKMGAAIAFTESSVFDIDANGAVTRDAASRNKKKLTMLFKGANAAKMESTQATDPNKLLTAGDVTGNMTLATDGSFTLSWTDTDSDTVSSSNPDMREGFFTENGVLGALTRYRDKDGVECSDSNKTQCKMGMRYLVKLPEADPSASLNGLTYKMQAVQVYFRNDGSQLSYQRHDNHTVTFAHDDTAGTLSFTNATGDFKKTNLNWNMGFASSLSPEQSEAIPQVTFAETNNDAVGVYRFEYGASSSHNRVLKMFVSDDSDNDGKPDLIVGNCLIKIADGNGGYHKGLGILVGYPE